MLNGFNCFPLQQNVIQGRKIGKNIPPWSGTKMDSSWLPFCFVFKPSHSKSDVSDKRRKNTVFWIGIYQYDINYCLVFFTLECFLAPYITDRIWARTKISVEVEGWMTSDSIRSRSSVWTCMQIGIVLGFASEGKRKKEHNVARRRRKCASKKMNV